MTLQERERALISLYKKLGRDVSTLKVLEIGSGSGINILKMIEMGFKPENITGIELIKERADSSRKKLSSEVKIINNDALEYEYEEKYDLIFQFVVFSSILDDDFRKRLANKMESLLNPGGAIIWYDFIYNNPKNKDVKGIKLKKVRSLFEGKITYYKKVTLAPPISRKITKVSPKLYNLLNMFSFLRTHLLCLIRK